MSRTTRALAVAAAGALMVPAAAPARVTTVYAGAPKKHVKKFDDVPAEANAFYPRKTTIHVGDSLKLVTFGGYNFDIPPNRQGPLPSITLDASRPINATDAAGNAFWFNGAGSPLFNPVLSAPQGGSTYDGTQRVATARPFAGHATQRVVKFTAVGKYPLYCDLCSGMKGQIIVVPRAARVPSPRQHAQAVERQVRRALAETRKLLRFKAPKNVLQAGARGRSSTDVLAMFPKTLRVKVGTVVTARMPAHSVTVHTVTFGPDAYIAGLLESLQAGLDPVAIYPSDHFKTTQPFPVDATVHGNGFVNSGLMLNGAPGTFPSSVRFRFTQPGTYKYICLVHPDQMRGKAIVR